MSETLQPLNIRFAQDTISNTFRGNGQSVNRTIDLITEGKILVENIPPMTVIERNGLYYSQDNRRLYVFRVLQCINHLNEVKVNIGNSFPMNKFTTNNEGTSVLVRNDDTRNHTCIETRSLDQYDNDNAKQKVKASDIRFFLDKACISEEDDQVVQEQIQLLVSMEDNTKYDDLITIDVIERYKKLYAVKTLKLYIARILECQGKLAEVKINVIKKPAINITTTNDGDHIDIKGTSKLWDHSRQSSQCLSEFDSLRI
ncbi:uncharacterized protein LOC143447096 [Clavelina lepadiformis]|uniref:Uncharacterized protein n=1 Tax=Clavelina lepadiformis TaxID=159417 RepID=A0ABP0GSQ4_CLALP